MFLRRRSQTRSQLLNDTFHREEMIGLRIGTAARLICAALLVVAVTFLPTQRPLYWSAVAAGVAVIVVVHYLARRRYPEKIWISYLYPVVEFGYLMAAAYQPPIFGEPAIPIQALNKINLQLIIMFFLTFYGFYLRPALVLWAGVLAGSYWLLLILYTASIPSQHVQDFVNDGHPALIWFQPDYVGIPRTFIEAAIFMMTAASVALIVGRLRSLVVARADIERQRTNLERYLPTSVAHELAGTDNPFDKPKVQEVVVVFVDIVGSTTRASHQPPEETIELLRDYDRLLTECTFEFGGTLEKFLGDGLMISFGRLHHIPDDAARALACAVAMVERVTARSAERGDDPPVTIGVGVHLGQVVLGNVGSDNRLEPAILGDVVNTASRIEALTRTLPGSVLFSDKVYEAVEQSADSRGLIEAATSLGPQPIRGRDEPIVLYGLDVLAGPSN